MVVCSGFFQSDRMCSAKLFIPDIFVAGLGMASLGDRFGIEKKKIVWICVVLMFLIGMIPTLSSTPILENVRVWGLDLYTLIDYITMDVCIPMGGNDNCFILRL